MLLSPPHEPEIHMDAVDGPASLWNLTVNIAPGYGVPSNQCPQLATRRALCPIYICPCEWLRAVQHPPSSQRIKHCIVLYIKLLTPLPSAVHGRNRHCSAMLITWYCCPAKLVDLRMSEYDVSFYLQILKAWQMHTMLIEYDKQHP